MYKRKHILNFNLKEQDNASCRSPLGIKENGKDILNFNLGELKNASWRQPSWNKGRWKGDFETPKIPII